MRKIRTTISLITTSILIFCTFAVATPTTAYASARNPRILAEAEEIALTQGYGQKVPVSVGEQTFAYNDADSISSAIRSLAVATGDENVINDSTAINSCYVDTMNGKWFALISSEAFHATFPGRDRNAYNDARKEAVRVSDAIFAQICAERGLNESGYPIITPSPAPTVAPVPVQPPTPAAPVPAAIPVPAAKLPTNGGIGTAYTIVPSAPKGFAMQSASYSSSNPGVATVDAAGNVTLVGGGKATIMIRIVSQKVDKRGRVVTRTSTVKRTVTVRQMVESISLNMTDATIAKSQRIKLSQSFVPATASNKAVTWASSNKRVATVSSSGVVVGKSAGIAVITCRAKDGSGASVSCTVTVTPVNPTGVRLSKSALPVKLGKTSALKATVVPKNADYKAVTWTSSDAAVAAVDARGRVRAVSPGTATITATTGNGLSAECVVNVH